MKKILVEITFQGDDYDDVASEIMLDDAIALPAGFDWKLVKEPKP